MRRSNLPAELNRFVGRAAEQAALAALLDTSRLVTIVGVGGVGKTRLALRVAATLRERHADGVRLVRLAPLRDPGLVPYALVEAFDLTDHTPRTPREVLLGHLAERRTLLVVDGFEHLVEPCAALLRELLEHSPGLTVLAAGRRALRVPGETVLPLAPLGTEEAVELLAERAAEAGAPALPGGATAAGRPAPAGETAAVAELCRRLDGIPLALELAAGRLPLLSAEQVLHRLDDRFRLLADGAPGPLPRHRTLRTAIGWSHELCTPEERLLWARLSVFPGPFDLEAVEYVCGGPELAPERVLDVLGGLLAQSLLVREDGAAGPAYRMLGTVAAYGAEWLAALGETERLRRRHRDLYMGLAAWCELEWFGPRQPEVATLLEAVLPHLRAALDLCLERPGEAHLAQHLAGSLWFAWAGCGRLSEGRHWLERALARESAHEEPRLKALWVLGYLAVLQGDRAAAVAALHACGEGARASGDALAEAYATHRLGCLALLSDDLPGAEELIGRALGAYRELGELNSNVLMAQVELGLARAFRGDLEGAASLCRDVRETCRERGELWAGAYALYVLAHTAWARGAFGEARELLTECVLVHHTFRDLVGLVLAIELLALVTVGEGDPVEAAVLQGAAAPLWDAVGVRFFGSAALDGPRARCERRTVEALGAAAFDAALDEGRRLSAAEAVERVLAAGRTQGAGPASVPRPFRGAGSAARGTRKPAGSPADEGGEAAG